MKVERHKIDDSYLAEMSERAERQFQRLPNLVQAAKERPKSLAGIQDNCHEAAAYGLLAAAPASRILESLTLGARASAVLFATVGASPSNPLTVKLDDGPPVMYTSAADESTLHDGRWRTGFYLSVISGEKESLDRLCSTPLESLRSSSTKGAEYQFLYAKALQDYVTGRWDNIVQTMLTAVKATDPNRADIVDPDWTVDLHVPQLEVLIYVVTKDAKFGDALQKAVKLHQSYWSKKKERRQSYRGFFSVELTGLAKMGLAQGLSFDVESPYIPMDLIR